ncbi:YjgN family protein [Pigmentibacter sp. JX0631]|uniref:YjgN family protein n=1 Tax=Pigmentibacter sp. JX0631 TaxID=2976982 RepID=UPI002468FEA7|nr:YjgN family protein [Pigmentibacter sp. JX0631]WGL59379.1 YjgN family protein [Pigmentibacter sp. JX0631]
MEEKKIEQFNFTGKGIDYFKIWITNTVLIILTCGIYYAWAKVRKTQYFMQNSWFQGNHFNYHANPIAILKGNIFVLIFFGLYLLVSYFSSNIAALVFLSAFLLFPFFITKSMQYHLTNISYKGIHFNYQSNLKKFYIFFFSHIFLNLITLFIIFPYTLKKYNDIIYSNIKIGDVFFKIHTKTKEFYFIYFKLIGISILVFSPFVIYNILFGTEKTTGIVFNIATVITVFVNLIYTILAFYKLVINNLSICSNNFETNISFKKYFFTNITNTILIVITFGLYMPFAEIKLKKLLLEKLYLEINEEMIFKNENTGNSNEILSQSSEITNSLFGIDIGV